MYKFKTNIPIYLQIADFLTKDIINGKYLVGSQIPSVRELASIFSVNPNTCQKAVSELIHLEIIVTISTNGNFVTTDKEVLLKCRDQILTRITDNFIGELTEYGFTKEEVIEKLKQKGVIENVINRNE